VKLLADSSALVALYLKGDENEEAAREFVRSSPAARFILTDLIFAEVVTHLRFRAGPSRAASVGRDLLGSERFELFTVDTDLIHGALARMERYRDKKLSLTDCASFETMERLRLEAAFAFDRDFRDCGFRMVPGAG